MLELNVLYGLDLLLPLVCHQKKHSLTATVPPAEKRGMLFLEFKSPDMARIMMLSKCYLTES